MVEKDLEYDPLAEDDIEDPDRPKRKAANMDHRVKEDNLIL